MKLLVVRINSSFGSLNSETLYFIWDMSVCVGSEIPPEEPIRGDPEMRVPRTPFHADGPHVTQQHICTCISTQLGGVRRFASRSITVAATVGRDRRVAIIRAFAAVRPIATAPPADGPPSEPQLYVHPPPTPCTPPGD